MIDHDSTLWMQVTRERDALRAEVERLRGIVQADLEEKAEAWGEVERLTAELKRVTGPREPPHCPSCDCPGPSPGASHGS